ncbi:MAG: hypothetical protein F6K19_06335 [Cyanothece sp. SIO1E1]|nr:hypothetical protein [Cyanothece sp. SIO1E1]
MKHPYLLFFMLFFSFSLAGQKVMQIETSGRVKTRKIFKGEGLEYNLRESDVWTYGVIEDFNIERNLIVFGDRYVNVDEIAAIRYYQPAARRGGIQLALFGAAWSTFALVGTATDGNPDTNYRWSDAIVTGTAMGLGYATAQLFKYKKFKIGKRRRLRLIDLTFLAPPNDP